MSYLVRIALFSIVTWMGVAMSTGASYANNSNYVFKEHVFDRLGEFIDFTTYLSEDAIVEVNKDYTGPDDKDDLSIYRAAKIFDYDSNYLITIYAYSVKEISSMVYWSEVLLKTREYKNIYSNRNFNTKFGSCSISYGQSPNTKNPWLFPGASAGIAASCRNGGYVLVILGEYKGTKEDFSKKNIIKFIENISFLNKDESIYEFRDEIPLLWSSKKLSLTLSKNWQYRPSEKRDVSYLGGTRGASDNTNSLINIVVKPVNEGNYEKRAVSYVRQFVSSVKIFELSDGFEVVDFNYLDNNHKIYSYKFNLISKNGYNFMIYVSFFAVDDVDISVFGLIMRYDNEKDFSIFRNFVSGMSNYESILKTIDGF